MAEEGGAKTFAFEDERAAPRTRAIAASYGKEIPPPRARSFDQATRPKRKAESSGAPSRWGAGLARSNSQARVPLALVVFSEVELLLNGVL